MLDTIEAVSLLTIMEIVGPILLGAALVLWNPHVASTQ